jgi:hypothetical protein
MRRCYSARRRNALGRIGRYSRSYDQPFSPRPVRVLFRDRIGVTHLEAPKLWIGLDSREDPWLHASRSRAYRISYLRICVFRSEAMVIKVVNGCQN